MSLISIIIPTFNRANLILETLESIKNQTYINWECIIVDDGSTDKTELILKNYIEGDSRFIYFKRPEKLIKGPNSCRNYGFAKAKGDYIQWFDSDDLMLSNHLETKVKYIGNCDGVVNPLAFFKEGKVTKLSNIKAQENLVVNYYVGKIAFYVSGVLWSKRFIDENKIMFDVKISNLDDWDYNIRLLLSKPKLKYLEEATIKYRITQHSLSRQIDKGNEQEIRSEIFARHKILKLIKIHPSFEEKRVHSFLRQRFLYLYRIALNSQKYQLAKKCYKVLNKVETSFFNKLKYKLAYYTYKWFNKGYILLK